MSIVYSYKGESKTSDIVYLAITAGTRVLLVIYNYKVWRASLLEGDLTLSKWSQQSRNYTGRLFKKFLRNLRGKQSVDVHLPSNALRSKIFKESEWMSFERWTQRQEDDLFIALKCPIIKWSCVILCHPVISTWRWQCILGKCTCRHLFRNLWFLQTFFVSSCKLTIRAYHAKNQLLILETSIRDIEIISNPFYA